MKKLKERVYRKNPDADSERLKRIVDKCNWYVGSGQRIPVTIGHTPDNLQKCKECDGSGKGNKDGLCPCCDGKGAIDIAVDFLPVDVGCMENFATDGEFVYADLDLDDAFEDAIKRHRGKSVELYSDDLLFPLSLLAHNRPATMLGPTKYELDGPHTTQTIPEPEEDTDMDSAAVQNLITETILNSAPFAQIKELSEAVSRLVVQCSAQAETIEKLQWLMDDVEAEVVGEGEGEELPPEVAAEEANESPAEKVAENASDEAKEHPELPAGEIEKIAEDHVAEGKEENPAVEQKNDMAMPSGTNTMVPTTGTGATPPKKKNYEELALESETYRLEAENQKALAAEYAGQVQSVATQGNETKAAFAELERKYKMLSRRNDLILLSGRYQFDPDAEMALAEKMDDEQFETHKKTVVVKYAMPPVNKSPISVGELPKPVAGPEKIETKDRVMQVVKYCERMKSQGKQITFDQGMKELFGEKA